MNTPLGVKRSVKFARFNVAINVRTTIQITDCKLTPLTGLILYSVRSEQDYDGTNNLNGTALSLWNAYNGARKQFTVMVSLLL